MVIYVFRLAYESLCAYGCRRHGQYSAILPVLPRQQAVDLYPCPSSWKRAVDLRPTRCCWTVLIYRKCVPTTRTRRSTTFVSRSGGIRPYCPRTRGGTYTSIHSCCHSFTVLYSSLSRHVHLRSCLLVLLLALHPRAMYNEW